MSPFVLYSPAQNERRKTPRLSSISYGSKSHTSAIESCVNLIRFSQCEGFQEAE